MFGGLVLFTVGVSVLVVLFMTIVVVMILRARARVPVAVERKGGEASPDLDDADGLVAFGDGVDGVVPSMGVAVASGERGGGGTAGDVREPTWPQRLQRNAGLLDRDARLRLIADLGLLRAGWCVPILQQAITEETDPGVRDAAAAALARCNGRAVRFGDVPPVSRNGSPKTEDPSPSG